MVALLVNVGQQEKTKTITMKPLQRRHRNQAITKLLHSDVVFSYFKLFPSFISWEFKPFNLSLVNFWYIRVTHTIITVSSVYTRNIATGHSTDQCYLWQYLQVHIEETFIIALIQLIICRLMHGCQGLLN